MTPARLLLVLSALALAGCRDHLLEDGDYAFSVTEVLRDDCGLAGTEVLGPATLRTEGNLVSLSLTRPELRLVGTYRSGLEELTVDGNLTNVTAVLRGRECLLDTVTLHLDGRALDPGAFAGAVAISWEARQPDECVCKYWFRYEARRAGGAR